MELIISAIQALGTLSVAVAAIWGDWLRSYLLPPRLRIELLDPRDKPITQTRQIQQGGQLVRQDSEARYYHLRLSNDKPFAVAHEAQVVFTRIERESPNGHPQTVYQVAVPLAWRNQRELDPRPWRTVGRQPHEADLLYVRQDGLFLTPMVVPNNFPVCYPSGQRIVFWVTVQARSIDAESEALRLEVAWDGAWEPGDAEMARHLLITPA